MRDVSSTSSHPHQLSKNRFSLLSNEPPVIDRLIPDNAATKTCSEVLLFTFGFFPGIDQEENNSQERKQEQRSNYRYQGVTAL